jgi:hypothetical protein
MVVEVIALGSNDTHGAELVCVTITVDGNKLEVTVSVIDSMRFEHALLITSHTKVLICGGTFEIAHKLDLAELLEDVVLLEVLLFEVLLLEVVLLKVALLEVVLLDVLDPVEDDLVEVFKVEDLVDELFVVALLEDTLEEVEVRIELVVLEDFDEDTSALVEVLLHVGCSDSW